MCLCALQVVHFHTTVHQLSVWSGETLYCLHVVHGYVGCKCSSQNGISDDAHSHLCGYANKHCQYWSNEQPCHMFRKLTHCLQVTISCAVQLLELMEHTLRKATVRCVGTQHDIEQCWRQNCRCWQSWWWAVGSVSRCHQAYSTWTNTLFEIHVSWMHYVILWWHCLTSQFSWHLYNTLPSSRHLEAEVYANKLAHLERWNGT